MKTPAETAVEAFTEADNKFQELVLQHENGTFLPELIALSGGQMQKMQDGWKSFRKALDAAREDRNAKLAQAQNEVRHLLKMATGSSRGINGDSTKAKVGPFSGFSVTTRTFDPHVLMSMASNSGLLERLMELEGVDKDGKKFKYLEQEWKVAFEPLLHWLRENNLGDMVTAAYREVEKTPQVRGPKEVAWLGEEKKSS